jgi:hypothetical protein
MIFVAFSFLVFFEIALCLRADGILEWSWLQVFLPLFLFDAALLIWTTSGLITRSTLERRAYRVAAANLLAKRQQDLIRSLNRKYRSIFSDYFLANLSVGHDLAIALDDANRDVSNMRASSLLSSLDEPEYGALSVTGMTPSNFSFDSRASSNLFSPLQIRFSSFRKEMYTLTQ